MTSAKRVTRLVYGLYIAFAAIFVVDSVRQVANAVFGPGPAAEHAALPTACATGVRGLAHAVDEAFAAAATATSVDEAQARYDAVHDERYAAREAEVARACGVGQPATATEEDLGVAALAAVARYDREARGTATRSARGLAPMRGALDSFIR